MPKFQRRVIVTGGGTGGHLYPGLAILDALAQDFRTLYAGNRFKIEGRVVPQTVHRFVHIPSVPFPHTTLSWIRFIPTFAWSLVICLWILVRYRPSLIIGMGGYVSFPLSLLGKILGFRVIVHEANVHVGKANRTLIRFGARLICSFPETAKGAPTFLAVVGCPVREVIVDGDPISARTQLGIPLDKKICLFVGGSGGANFITDIFTEFATVLDSQRNIYAIHITGKRLYHYAMEKIGRILPSALSEIKLLPYADDIHLWYQASDLVVARSGSSTVNELIASKKASILIPSPNVAENHQEANARFMEKHGYSICITEDTASTAIARVILETMIASDGISTMRSKLAACSRPWSDPSFVSTIKSFIENTPTP